MASPNSSGSAARQPSVSELVAVGDHDFVRGANNSWFGGLPQRARRAQCRRLFAYHFILRFLKGFGEILTVGTYFFHLVGSDVAPTNPL
jgi:hypothetical protein